MKYPLLIGAVAGTLAALFVYMGQDNGQGPAATPQGAALAEVSLPPELSGKAQIGKQAFEGACAACHGTNAAGNNGKGPPLIHPYYKPSHHGDIAFQMAVQNGVRAHHWPFGDMPPQEGLTKADVEAIVAYVRELQRANGIE